MNFLKEKLARNQPCWCGSGKKYKNCHFIADKANRTPSRHPTSSRIIIKSEEQIAAIRKSCQLVKQTLDRVNEIIREGITTLEINDWVHNFIIANKGIPAPLNYKGFPKSVCTSINDVICHGVPDGTRLKNGDIINVDVTIILNGYYGDCSRMYYIGEPSAEARKLVEVTKECLYIGIEHAKPMNTIGDIGYAIQQHAEKHGYSVVKDYAGHGVGLKFHEEPTVNHFGKKGTGPEIMPNMVFTIEPMINMGGYQSKVLADKWTAVTVDGSLSAQWEHTVRTTETSVEILTE